VLSFIRDHDLLAVGHSWGKGAYTTPGSSWSFDFTPNNEAIYKSMFAGWISIRKTILKQIMGCVLNDLSVPKIIGLALAALPAGAGLLYFQRRNLGARRRKDLHPLLILGIIFLFPGIFTLVIDGEESVYLSLGIVFTIFRYHNPIFTAGAP